jgi:hypothetical protein
LKPNNASNPPSSAASRFGSLNELLGRIDIFVLKEVVAVLLPFLLMLLRPFILSLQLAGRSVHGSDTVFSLV